MSWPVVHTAYSRPDAEVIGAILRGNGIEVVITSDDTGTLGPELAFSNGVQIRVPEQDAARAAGLLEHRSPAHRPGRPGR